MILRRSVLLFFETGWVVLELCRSDSLERTEICLHLSTSAGIDSMYYTKAYSNPSLLIFFLLTHKLVGFMESFSVGEEIMS